MRYDFPVTDSPPFLMGTDGFRVGKLVDTLAITRAVKDTTALALYAGTANVATTPDGRHWQLCTSDVSNGRTNVHALVSGRTYFFTTTTLTPNAGALISASVSLGTGLFWLYLPVDGVYNVKHFGAAFDGGTDDSAAIQATVNWCKLFYAGNGGMFRPAVKLPNGWGNIRSAIDCTNASGLYIFGSGGRYLNTTLLGNTTDSSGTGGTAGSGKGIMFDFTGSTCSGIQDVTLCTDAGYGATASKIGILFALGQDGSGNQTGGLNNYCRNLYFQMDDLATANGGAGTIGIAAIRCEEIELGGIFGKANSPIVLSNTADLSAVGCSVTLASQYATIMSGLGSEGVINITTGANSLQSVGKRRPALTLNGTNNVHFQGYISRAAEKISVGGTEETAILCGQSCFNLTVQATVESYSRIIRANNYEFEGANIRVVSANTTSPNTELFDFTGAFQRNNIINVEYTNPGERAAALLIYHAPVGGGNEPATGSMLNCQIGCPQITDNTKVISANLLANADNCQFSTRYPFEKVGYTVRQLYRNLAPAGLIGSATAATILRFSQADRVDTTQNNGGIYSLKVEGVVRAGGSGSDHGAVLRFVATTSLVQVYNSGMAANPWSVTLLETSTSDPAMMNITDLTFALTFSGGVGTVTVLPTVTGARTGNGITVYATGELTSHFYVNCPVIYP